MLRQGMKHTGESAEVYAPHSRKARVFSHPRSFKVLGMGLRRD